VTPGQAARIYAAGAAAAPPGSVLARIYTAMSREAGRIDTETSVDTLPLPEDGTLETGLSEE
jgi:hypothetical protein